MDRSYWARVLLCCLALLAARGSSMSAEAHEFTVGGTKGWSVPSGTDRTETYSQWAARNRFQVGDTLLFKYNRSVDSVVQVGTEEDYSSCNTSKAIKTFDDGNTVFQLNRSGPFYFITGNSGNCKKGQKLVLVVISLRHGAVGGAGPAPGPARSAPGPRVASPAPNGTNSPAPAPSAPGPRVASPAPNGSNSPAPAPSAPGPRLASPAPNGSNSPAPAPAPSAPGPRLASPAPSIASSPSPSIAGIPATSPAPSAGSPASGTPSGSPTPSNGRGSPANAPRAGAPFAAPPAPPVSSPSSSEPTPPPPPQSAVRSPAPSPSVLLTLLCLAIGAVSYYPAFR